MWSKDNNKKAYFTEIYNQNFEYVYGYTFARTAGNRQLAEDIVQETFAAAWLSIDRFNGKSTYHTWLCSIAKNKLRENYRKAIYREKLEFADDDKLEAYAGRFDLEKIVIDNETRLYVLEVLEGMNPLYRYALIMKYIDGLSVKEISKVLGKTAKAVDGVLQRAKVTFAKGYLNLERKGMMKIMNDRALEELIKTIESEVRIPEGVEEQILVKVFATESDLYLYLTPFERFIYEKPLRIAGCISISISGMLWSIMGGGFANWVSGFIR